MNDTDDGRRGTDRRTVLKGIGGLTAVAAVAGFSTSVGAQAEASFSVEQGNHCVPLSPVSDSEMTVEEFYGYTVEPTDGKGPYEANTPGNIGKPDTSYVFLYEGPDGLSLVFVHGGGKTEQGGAATFELSGLPEQGAWVVKSDDYGDDPDAWNVSPGETTVDWSWNKFHDDGGAFGPLGDEFELEITPHFNGAANLEPETPGTITEWRTISEDSSGRSGVSLDLDESIVIRSEPCE